MFLPDYLPNQHTSPSWKEQTLLKWQCDKNREDLLVEKKLKKYTLPVIAAILTLLYMKSKAWFLQGKFWEFTDFLKFLLRQSSFCAIICAVSSENL